METINKIIDFAGGKRPHSSGSSTDEHASVNASSKKLASRDSLEQGEDQVFPPPGLPAYDEFWSMLQTYEKLMIKHRKQISMECQHSLKSVLERCCLILAQLHTENTALKIQVEKTQEIDLLKTQNEALITQVGELTKNFAESQTATKALIDSLSEKIDASCKGTDTALLKFGNQFQSQSQEVKTFADAVKGKLENLPIATPIQTPHQTPGRQRRRNQPRQDFPLVIAPRDTSKTNYKVNKEDLKKAVDPSKLEIGVEKIHRGAKGEVVVHCSTAQEVTILQTCLDTGVWNAVVPRRKFPKMVIRRVPTNEVKTAEDLINLVFDSNQKIRVYASTIATSVEQLTTREEQIAELKKEFKPITAIGKKEASIKTWIVEVTPLLRKFLLELGSLNLKWERGVVSDYVSITQCFTCNGIGHISQHCTQKTAHPEKSACSGCGSWDHLFRDCKAAQPECSNCKRHGKTDTSHNARDHKCPLIVIHMKNQKSKTDYGQYAD